jgi:heme-degrading monooxygenase HmoA
MFIAMNRFKVRMGEEPAFETRWRERGWTTSTGVDQIARTRVC